MNVAERLSVQLFEKRLFHLARATARIVVANRRVGPLGRVPGVVRGAPGDVNLAADGPVALCLFHAAQAVEDGDVDPADLTVAPALDQRETAEEAR